VLYRTANERYEKLKRVFRRLMRNFNRDDLDDFIQTANSLRPWIERDRNLSREQRDHLARFVVSESLDWQICNQIANTEKHGDSKPRTTKARSGKPIPKIRVSASNSFVPGTLVPPTMKIVGAGEEIQIEWDGGRESAFGFVVRTFLHFHFIFELALIPVERRRIPDLGAILTGTDSGS